MFYCLLWNALLFPLVRYGELVSTVRECCSRRDNFKFPQDFKCVALRCFVSPY